MDKRENEYVLWFDELRRADVGLVGGKSSSLGELTSATKVPVPYGYATTANAYRYFMDVTGQNKKIHELLEGLDDVEDSVELHEVCTRIRQSIMDAEMQLIWHRPLLILMMNWLKRLAKRIHSLLYVPALPQKIFRTLPSQASRIPT